MGTAHNALSSVGSARPYWGLADQTPSTVPRIRAGLRRRHSKPVGTIRLGFVRGLRAACDLEVGRVRPAIRCPEANELDLGELEGRDRLLTLEVLLASLEHGRKPRSRARHGLDLDL